MAKELGIDLGLVRGTGSGGRITRDDIEAFVESDRAIGPFCAKRKSSII
jgi:pyruvate/2-oxoglutarate dehydrogenase complex dihydrolipoamide acyltransferase (E2) component